MNIEPVTLDQTAVHKLLASGSGDAALLHLYLACGNDPAEAERALRLPEGRLSCAAATLRQLGLWPEERKIMPAPGERPSYSERDVMEAMDQDKRFRMLYGEVQRVLGRNLNTEELKILLGFVRYLGLPAEVVSVLVTYCKDRARQNGRLRNPSLRAIEKEAYYWAGQGIDTLEEAAAFLQAQNVRHSRMSRLMGVLQIRGRNLTPAEERYAAAWLELGFDEEAFSMAYERTCLNTGGLNWAYMNKILTRWHEAGLHSGQQIVSADRKPGTPAQGQRKMDQDEQAAIARLMREG